MDLYDTDPPLRDGDKLDGSYSLDIELKLTGSFRKGYPATGPSYASGGEPGEPPGVEDMEIADVGTHVRGRGFVSLLDGVDRSSAAYQQIVSNILAVVGDDVREYMEPA